MNRRHNHVRVISQGAIKVNIGLVVRQADVQKAVAALHAHFFYPIVSRQPASFDHPVVASDWMYLPSIVSMSCQPRAWATSFDGRPFRSESVAF